MQSYGRAFYHLKNKLLSIYDERESAAIAHELLLHITGFDRAGRLINKDKEFTQQQQDQFESATNGLLNGRPLQYITGSTWFMGKEFLVNEHVLIPRPETEELVEWIKNDISATNKPVEILDIGTGSGCIAISLKILLPFVKVNAIDISDDALEVAKENAKRLNAEVEFLHLDFLDQEQRNKQGGYDVIVSNPPYIKMSDKYTLHPNVRDHEPAIALFVPDDDKLIFYKDIAAFGETHLNAGGAIYCETEATHSVDCYQLFKTLDYVKHVEQRKDMHGNWRMLKVMTEKNGR